jgi:hypothetical protein
LHDPQVAAGPRRLEMERQVAVVVFTLGAALSNSTPERPCASLPVTTRRIGLTSVIRFDSAGTNGNR